MGMADSDKGGSGSGGGGVGGGGRGGGSTGGYNASAGAPPGSEGGQTTSGGTAGGGAGPGQGPGTGGGADGSHATGGGTGGNNGGSSGGSDRGGSGGNSDAGSTSTAASRARDAMDRRAKEAADAESEDSGSLVGDTTNLGIGKEYSHADAIAERAKEGAVSPREADIARGYSEGKTAQMAGDAFGGMISRAASAASSVPGVGKVAGMLTDAGMEATVTDTPESKYGASVARSRAKNSMAQNVAETAAGVLAGPPGVMAAQVANTAINDQKTADINRMNEAMGFNTGSTNPNVDGGGAQVPAAPAQPEATVASSDPFSWSPVDIENYGQGLLTLAQNA